MNVNQMRGFLKSKYQHSPNWGKKVDNMPDEQVIAIYMNPYITMPKNHGRVQQQQAFKEYNDAMLLQNQKTNNLSWNALTSLFNVESPSPDYRICPHCGARLDIDAPCDCYGSH